ncbi:alpha-N-acetylglucosaminidase [Musca vetustissima]|uniref:alpha-N-acetylglucosaminidase n=1 Tax=Musca vetustissima TaxID=27455 RepID=UPI002AB6980F|nr:alpha-N-acetylglucosaminidase [Musca vetustissima]
MIFNVTQSANYDFRNSNVKNIFSVCVPITTTNQKVYIRAFDGISAAKGFHYYLKHWQNRSIYWYNEPIKMNNLIIKPNVNISSKCESSYIYYQNVCAWGYSYVWWNWTTWVKHIDWMVMMGISLSIAPIQEDIWYNTYMEMGLTEDEINKHFSGPAFLPWLRMGNIHGWAGPMPSYFRKMQMYLQQNIIRRQRAFGMKVAIPAFSGYVPEAMKRIFPNASFVRAAPWNKFKNDYCCSLFVKSFDPLFRKISDLFLKKTISVYGTDHIYFADPFNEMQPESSDPAYLKMTAKFIYNSMRAVDRRAVWLLQSWMFLNYTFWEKSQTKAFLTAVPKGGMLVLDLQSEQFPQYERTEFFYGHSFIWCMLHNFGGTLGMHGSSEKVNKNIGIARLEANGNMVGVGITPEGINQNYVMYALALERAWEKNEFNLTTWFTLYSDVRYGVANKNLRRAWQLLRTSVYSYNGKKKLHGKYLIARRPSLHLIDPMWYNVSDIYNAWSNLLQSSYSIPCGYRYEYEHDLVDITRQFLQVKFAQIYINMINAFKRKEYDTFDILKKLMISILLDVEHILSTNKAFLLGKWIEGSHSWSVNAKEKHILEFNARNQITLWGPHGEIVDYATKQWSGVIQDLFYPRWKLFLDYLSYCLYKNQTFNSNIITNDIYNLVEIPFNYQRKMYPTDSRGDAYQASKQIFMKW